MNLGILEDPGADSGDEGKSKRAEKCAAKKSKERREQPLGTMSYQPSSKRSKFFKDQQKCTSRWGECTLWSLKNLQVLIYSKLHEKNPVITYLLII